LVAGPSYGLHGYVSKPGGGVNFGRKYRVKIERQLTITPTVIKSTQDMRETVNDLIDRMDLVEPLVRRGVKDQVKTTIEPELKINPKGQMKNGEIK
jgi:hypothetical protein